MAADQPPGAGVPGANLPDALRSAVADSVRLASPAADLRVDRLRISVSAGANASTVAEAVARAIRIELARRR